MKKNKPILYDPQIINRVKQVSQILAAPYVVKPNWNIKNAIAPRCSRFQHFCCTENEVKFCLIIISCICIYNSFVFFLCGYYNLPQLKFVVFDAFSIFIA